MLFGVSSGLSLDVFSLSVIARCTAIPERFRARHVRVVFILVLLPLLFRIHIHALLLLFLQSLSA